MPDCRFGRAPSRGDYVYISDDAGLKEFVDKIRGTSVLAIDTEFLRERTYHPKLCLVQLATADVSAIIDPLLVGDLSPLADLLADGRITKVFHACSQDLEVLFSALGCVPSPIFDTQVAAGFLGQRLQLGYGALVEAYCGVHLAKAESLTDWSRRPLDPEQLRYAEDDVRYLPGIYATMMEELVQKGRLGWVLPEFEALSDPRHLEHRPEDAYIHLKRSGALTRKQLGIAREICAWREREAASGDVPRRWVVSDEVVVECSKRMPQTPERLLRIRGTEQLSQRTIHAIISAVKRALAQDPATYPSIHRHARPSAEAEPVVDLMYALLRLKAEHEGIAPQLIATRDDLADFLDDPQGSALMSSWRRNLVGRDLERLLEGEIGLTVKEGRIEVL